MHLLPSYVGLNGLPQAPFMCEHEGADPWSSTSYIKHPMLAI